MHHSCMCSLTSRRGLDFSSFCPTESVKDRSHMFGFDSKLYSVSFDSRTLGKLCTGQMSSGRQYIAV